jgi:hypothetical protein
VGRDSERCDMKGFDPPRPAQAICGRCANLFAYFRRTAPRLYCTTCIPLEKAAYNDFYSHQTAIKRLLDRRNAIEAHAHA